MRMKSLKSKKKTKPLHVNNNVFRGSKLFFKANSHSGTPAPQRKPSAYATPYSTGNTETKSSGERQSTPQANAISDRVDLLM